MLQSQRGRNLSSSSSGLHFQIKGLINIEIFLSFIIRKSRMLCKKDHENLRFFKHKFVYIPIQKQTQSQCKYACKGFY